MADGDIPLSDYHKALRGKAAAGLEQLRQKLSISPAPSPRRQGVSSKTPTAYSASVDRLKGLINKYESQKKKGCAMDISFSPLTMPQPDELAPLLNDQHTLLQHLEGQVDYYKDALSILKQKAEMVIEENARLHDQLRSQIVNDMDFVDVSGNKELSDQEDVKLSSPEGSPEVQVSYNEQTPGSVKKEDKSIAKVQTTNKETMTDKVGLDELEIPRDTETRHETLRYPPEIKQHDYTGHKGQELRVLEDDLEDMKALYASKAKHLESLLYAARNDLEESQRQVSRLQAQLRSRPAMTEKGIGMGSTQCMKCAQNEAFLGPEHSDVQNKVIQRLEREKNELMDALNKQRKLLADMRKRELEAYTQVKKSCEMVEQAQLEKHEIIVQHQQLKQELGRQHERYNQYLKTSTETLKKEKQKIEDDYRLEIKKLENKIDELTEKLTAMEVQLERTLREKVDLRSELEHTKSEIIAHETEITNIMDEMRNEVANAVKERALTEQENQSLLQENKQLRNWKERELDWINSELEETKKKLKATEKHLEISKEDCIKLSEEIRRSKKQTQALSLGKKSQEKWHADEMKRAILKAQQREQELNFRLQESEDKYVTTKEDLSGLLQSQIQIADRFKNEYQKLAEKVEHTQQKHSDAVGRYRQEIHNLQKQIDEQSLLKQQYEKKLSDYDESLEAFKDSLCKKDEECKQLTDRIIALMNKQNTIMKERQLLCSEIEFLRTQLPGLREDDVT